MSVPESNIDIVAFNIANHAVVDELNRPGNALVELFSQMSHLAGDITGITNASKADWDELLKSEPTIEESEATVDRQHLAVADSWAAEWALAHIAKHLHRELERHCLEQSASEHIASIKYDGEGNVLSWRPRSTS